MDTQTFSYPDPDLLDPHAVCTTFTVYLVRFPKLFLSCLSVVYELTEGEKEGKEVVLKTHDHPFGPTVYVTVLMKITVDTDRFRLFCN